MSGHRHAPSPARPRPVPRTSSSGDSRGRSPAIEPVSRATSTARLAVSPAASSGPSVAPPIPQVPTPSQLNTANQTPLAGAESSGSLPGPGHSALAAALQGSFGKSPPSFGTPPRFETPSLQPLTPTTAGATLQGSGNQSTYGSLDTRSVQGAHGWASPTPNENPEVVKRHLVQPSNLDSREDSAERTPVSLQNKPSEVSLGHGRHTGKETALDDDEFSSLQLQGGDVTRQVYKWTEDAESRRLGGRFKRSQSYHISRPQPESSVLDINSIKVPGGFRRDYLRRKAPSTSPLRGGQSNAMESAGQGRRQPRFVANNFIEFLTIYGHFAGEDLEDDDDELGPNECFSSDTYEDAEFFGSNDGGEEDREPGEGSALLTPGTPGRRRRKQKERGATGSNSATGAALLLLKSFVGTGVLFLPKAYLNGGMLFSNVVLLGVASLSYYCFILLVNTRLKVEGSFGDMGGILYGKYMRALILSSVALSQIGFVSAYIVFTSENLQAFILAISKCRSRIDIKFMVLMQLIIFLPLSLIRDISKLGVTALVADAFIFAGLVYLGYYDISTLATNGVSDIVNFNPRDWTLFIGTAIFTFEGVGLIIPIQESMKQPSKFPPVLAGVMIGITAIFVSMGAMSYAAFGSATKTVILLNLPQDDKFVNAVQFLYSLAILLSTPLQLFPAIRIMENEIFTRSGKYNPYIKWKKNIFRFFLVLVCALIAWGGAGDLDKFVAIVGSFACVPLVYVYPVSPVSPPLSPLPVAKTSRSPSSISKRLHNPRSSGRRTLPCVSLDWWEWCIPLRSR